MADIYFPQKVYMTTKGRDKVFSSVDEACIGEGFNRVEVAEYIINRVVVAKMVADIQAEMKTQ